MPHSTTIRRDRSWSTAGQSRSSEGMEKFPDIDTSFMGHTNDADAVLSAGRFEASPLQAAAPPLERWHNKLERYPLPGGWVPKQNGNGAPIIRTHGRQKSLSEAYKHIRTRKGSVSANAHEIAEALKAPVSWKLVVCLYLSIQSLTVYNLINSLRVLLPSRCAQNWPSTACKATYRPCTNHS